MKIPQLALEKLQKLALEAGPSPGGSRRGSRRPSLVVTAAPGQPGSRRDSIIMDLAVSRKSRAGSISRHLGSGIKFLYMKTYFT